MHFTNAKKESERKNRRRRLKSDRKRKEKSEGKRRGEKEKKREKKKNARRDISPRLDLLVSLAISTFVRSGSSSVGISRLHHQEEFLRRVRARTHARKNTHALARSLTPTHTHIYASMRSRAHVCSLARSLARRLCPTSPLDKVVAGINWPCSPRCIPVDLLELQHET